MLCYRYYYIYLCNCGHCIVMPTVAECIWCCEIDTTIQKMGQIQAQISCITEHEGFEPVCLNFWVLQAGYFSYRQHYGTHDIQDQPGYE